MTVAWIARILAAGGGGAIVAYAIFRFLGKTWLDQYFSKQLEQFKHDRQAELELFRHDINALFSRISKIHEKEFEVLPMAWSLLHRAHGAAYEAVSSFKRGPDFSRMTAPQFEEFVRDCGLADFQKQELREAEDKQKYYREARFWRELYRARQAQTELNNYLALNSIFMTEELRHRFGQINSALTSALTDEEANYGQPYNAATYKSVTANMARISDLFADIESAVQKRLRYEKA